MHVLLLIMVLVFSDTVHSIPDRLIVATKEAAPFSFKGPDQRWEGISIELWEEIARRQGWEYEYRVMGLEEMLQALESGSIDLGVAALTITAEREAGFDFSHAFHTSGLGIAVPAGKGGGLFRSLTRLISIEFLEAVAALAVLLLLVGFLVWLLERRRNPEQFGGSAAAGIGAGFWWSAVTMTTVGYGDKAPQTFWGRFLGLIWMFMAIIIISSFTAAIASALTVNQLQSDIQNPEDLRRVRVATLHGSTAEAYLSRNRIVHTGYDRPLEALQALNSGAADAMVYDQPILRYLIKEHFSGRLEILSFTFSRQDYGIGLPSGSPLRESLNQALLEIIRDPQWNAVLQKYTGERQ